MSLTSAKNGETPAAPTTEVSNVSVTCKELTMKSLAKENEDFTIFNFGGKDIRVANKNGEPWFVAKDVCDVLGIANNRDGIARLDDDEKDVALTDTLGGQQELAVVSESGMYTLVLRCRDAIKPGTIPHTFRKWVTSEVLPAIRKHGVYVKTRKTTVEERTPLRDAVNMLVGKKGLRYDDAYNMVHQRFGIDSIDELELEQIPIAVEYIHRIVLDGEFIGKHEELPTPALDINYPLTWWNQYSHVLKFHGMNPFSHTEACSLPVKMLYGDAADAPSPTLKLIYFLMQQGYDMSAIKLEILAYRHYLEVMHSRLERINQVSEWIKDGSTPFRISPPMKQEWR